jgi:hypothetical protein
MDEETKNSGCNCGCWFIIIIVIVVFIVRKINSPGGQIALLLGREATGAIQNKINISQTQNNDTGTKDYSETESEFLNAKYTGATPEEAVQNMLADFKTKFSDVAVSTCLDNSEIALELENKSKNQYIGEVEEKARAENTAAFLLICKDVISNLDEIEISDLNVTSAVLSNENIAFVNNSVYLPCDDTNPFAEPNRKCVCFTIKYYDPDTPLHNMKDEEGEWLPEYKKKYKLYFKDFSKYQSKSNAEKTAISKLIHNYRDESMQTLYFISTDTYITVYNDGAQWIVEDQSRLYNNVFPLP